MRKRLYQTLKSFLIMSLQFFLLEKDLYCRVVPIIDPNPQKSVKPRPTEWKYIDDLSESIRRYDRTNNNWYGAKQAVLSCQRRVLINYESKIDIITQEVGRRASKIFAKFEALENAKNHDFLACVRAFQILSASEKKMLQEKSGWKNNDDVSREIREDDRMRNRWVNEEEAISQCQRQAKSNYELRRKKFNVQNNYEEYQRLKDWEEKSFKACERAFER